MKLKILLAVVAALAIMASGAYADTLNGSSGGFQDYVIPNQDNTPYWDGNSSDNNSSHPEQAATVANFLTKSDWFAPITGGGASNNTFSPALTNPKWWGNNDGSAATNMFFHPTNTGATAAILVEVAGLADSNIFGWYNTGSLTPTLHQLFTGTDNALTAPKPFVPGGDYGFYLDVSGTIYYMNSALNVTDNGIQHFAVFRPLQGDSFGSSFFIGAEDLAWSGSDKDFQDMIVRVTPDGGSGQVPLPPSALLLGSGLLGLVALRWRRRNGNS